MRTLEEITNEPFNHKRRWKLWPLFVALFGALSQSVTPPKGADKKREFIGISSSPVILIASFSILQPIIVSFIRIHRSPPPKWDMQRGPFSLSSTVHVHPKGSLGHRSTASQPSGYHNSQSTMEQSTGDCVRLCTRRGSVAPFGRVNYTGYSWTEHWAGSLLASNKFRYTAGVPSPII